VDFPGTDMNFAKFIFLCVAQCLLLAIAALPGGGLRGGGAGAAVVFWSVAG